MAVQNPLVTVVCLSHNHGSYVREALDSVWHQTYASLELIIVDDASVDDSVAQIKHWMQDKPPLVFLPLAQNEGNCRAFNRALALAKGEYIIDLAADDVLLPERVADGVKAMEKAGPDWGVHFSDACYIDARGGFLKNHYRRKANGELLRPVPQGWVYRELLERYFICTPSMMMRKSVLDALGGYDENLAYEDFDFWLRSSRHWKYCYTDRILVKKRVLPRSWSRRQYEAASQQLASTLMICHKAKALNQNQAEDRALGKRLAYELRQAIRNRQWEMAEEFLSLKKEVWPVLWEDWVYALWLMSRK